MNVYEKKANFVRYELTDLIQKCDDQIARAEYEGNSLYERVKIVYTGGSCFNVNVTGDSLQVLAVDVLRHI